MNLTISGLAKSAHFQQRQAQRKLTDEQIDLALRFGEKFYQGNDCVYFLGRKRIPRVIDPESARRLDGTTVVVGGDQSLVTAFRNPEFRRHLRRCS